MTAVAVPSPGGVVFRDASRYRSTIILAAALFGLSAVVMGLFLRTDTPLISGEPGYLFSIPASAQDADARSSLSGPLAVAAYGDRIAVADSGAGKVKEFGWDGRYLRQISIAGGGGRGRAYPTALAYDDGGRLFVCDVVSDRIHVFDPSLDELYSFPEKGDPVRLLQPVAMAVTRDELYVTDVGDSSVKVYGLDGSFIREFASRENRKSDLAFPNGVGVASDGTVYVADSNNRKVLAFDPEGRQVLTFKYRFNLPRGIAVDELDRIHVVDTFAHRVTVFDKLGKALFEYGQAEGTEGRLGFANGIFVDSRTARVYVTDRGSDNVQVWGWVRE